MWHVIWEYHIKAESRAEFERQYAGNDTPASKHGAGWAGLFRRSPDYRGTLLLRTP